MPRKGRPTFRSRFLDDTGKFMLHCHMMNHEELGMMSDPPQKRTTACSVMAVAGASLGLRADLHHGSALDQRR